MSVSEFQWSEDAEARVEKVPEGFMRNMTKQRVEDHARKNGITEITPDTVKDVIETSRAGMGSMMGGDISGMPDHVKELLAEKEKVAKQAKAETDYYFCFVCAYAVPENPPEKCPNCGSESTKFSKLQSEYRTDAHTMFLKWSDNATKSLESTPDDYRREMTKYEIEGFARRSGCKVVTLDVVHDRMKVWEGISEKMVSELEWDEDARERSNKIPEHIRGMIVRETELFAKNAGKKIVTPDLLDAIKEKWGQTREFHVKWQ